MCKLNTRCSIIAATNPKGKYDPTQDIEVNIALASPLLSRFDIILILLDNRNEECMFKLLTIGDMYPKINERAVSSFLLQSEIAGVDLKVKSNVLWDLNTMRQYLTFVKTTCFPQLSNDSNIVLKRYYQMQRGTDLRNAARTTIRLLESLIRLSQAHARLCFRKIVTVSDAVIFKVILDCRSSTYRVINADQFINWSSVNTSFRVPSRSGARILLSR